VEIINIPFLSYPKKNKKAASEAQGETAHIDGGMRLITEDITPSNFEIIFKHTIEVCFWCIKYMPMRLKPHFQPIDK
jgi:hypothetical protein